MAFKHIVFDHDGTLVKFELNKKSLFDGVKEFLKALNQNGSKLYVWTARNRQSTIESLKSHGILHYFEDICTSTDADVKPSTDGLESMLGDTDKSHICVIGDSITDIVGAKSFKVMALGAAWNNPCDSELSYLKEYGADYVFKEVQECMSFVLENLDKE